MPIRPSVTHSCKHLILSYVRHMFELWNCGAIVCLDRELL
jgi:hypothetical protein